MFRDILPILIKNGFHVAKRDVIATLIFKRIIAFAIKSITQQTNLLLKLSAMYNNVNIFNFHYENDNCLRRII